MLVWHILSGARAQLKWTSSDDVASLDFPNVERSDDDNDGDGSPQLAELLVGRKAYTEKAKIYHEMGVGTIQSPQARATSTRDNASSQGKREDGIETGGLTPLHGAALQGDIESIEAALQEGADTEESSPDGATPLTLATSEGHYEAIKKLLASGAKIDAASTEGLTALMISIRKQDARTVKQLVCNGAGMNCLSPDGWTALTEASSQGRQEIMSILLQCGANPESRSAHDRTALMHASHKGDEAAVRLLLEAGSNTEATSAHGETAISLAAGGGYTNIVQMLLMSGCAPEPAWAKDQKDSSKGFSEKIKAKEIGEPEHNVHARGYTPLMFASQGGHVEIGRMLLERNVNTEARSPHGKTALDIARECGRIDMILILEFA